MIIRKEIDLPRSTMLRELFAPGAAPRGALEARIAAGWGAPAVVALSVRSGLDAWLAARAWPAGDEVVMTGANIPDMAHVVRHHGLHVRAVDFDLRELAPGVDAIAAAMTPRTRAIVVAQLFGARVDLAAVARLARERGADLIEDAAQAWHPDYRGHPDATVSMFSFGPIKSQTALGGAVLTVRDPAMLEALRDRFAAQPIASAWAFRRRLLQFVGLCTLCRPLPLALLDRWLRWRGADLDGFLAGRARSFAGRELLTAIRERPSAPLLRLLARRLAGVRRADFAARESRGAALARRLGARVDVPGAPGVPHAFWVFPVLCDDPQQVVARLRAAGIDATRRATLAPVAGDLPALERSFARLVYLPFAASHPEALTARIADVVLRAVSDGP